MYRVGVLKRLWYFFSLITHPEWRCRSSIMLTLLTVPKPFVGHIDVIQQNAIASWRLLGDDVDILLCGNDEGTAAAAQRHGARHLSDIRCNEYGTPFMDSVFAQAAAQARYSTLCFINTDIILLPDFRRALEHLDVAKLFVIGHRTDVDITTPINFAHRDWAVELRDFSRGTGRLRGPHLIDYFLFPRREELVQWPPLLIGRGVWDNWFVNRARDIGLRLVDATPSVTAIHQTHDYTHVKDARGGAWEGPEGDWNRRLVGEARNIGVITDATGVLWRGRVWPALGCQYVERRWQRWRQRAGANITEARNPRSNDSGTQET